MEEKKEMSIEDIIYEFNSYDPDPPDEEMEENEDDSDEALDDKDGPSKYQIEYALEHAISQNYTSIVSEIIKKYNIKLTNQHMDVGLLQSIENKDLETLEFWFNHNACPNAYHIEQIIERVTDGIIEDTERNRILYPFMNECNEFTKTSISRIITHLKNYGFKSLPVYYNILKELCNVHLRSPGYKYTDKYIDKTKSLRDDIIKQIIDIVISEHPSLITPFCLKTMIEKPEIDYQGIIITVHNWERNLINDMNQDSFRN